MALIVVTNNPNYIALDTATKALVDTAVTAVRNAFFEADKTLKKENVRVLLQEVVRLQEEEEAGA